MSLRTVISYAVAFMLGLLAVAPPINYSIPMVVNSEAWIYTVIACGLLAYFSLFLRLHWLLKVITLYLFANCFFSQVPYQSFNAFIVYMGAIYFFLLCQEADYGIILKVLIAVFLMQITISVIQFYGKDTLMSFADADRLGVYEELGLSVSTFRNKTVYFGTVLQHMRFGSLIAIMAPFLLLKNKLFIIPLFEVAIFCHVSGLMLALLAGVAVYVVLDKWISRRAALLAIVVENANHPPLATARELLHQAHG
jgi:hypothetical protein